MDVSWEIWLKGKNFYGYYEDGIENISRGGDEEVEIQKFLYKEKHYPEALKGEVMSDYSENERIIITSIYGALYDGRICMDETLKKETKYAECVSYEQSLKNLEGFYK
ncbi:hypothetical protein [Priestia megaterium]|uniref:hypothetical protein n=1 Tax=Priestia megaterium TaxID=1404 RepID=UPI001A944773|nr:hypothetical protein [Priestia megaterium]QSX23909.1 hypothetical protein J0P05_30245 [Priestia megaterium]